MLLTPHYGGNNSKPANTGNEPDGSSIFNGLSLSHQNYAFQGSVSTTLILRSSFFIKYNFLKQDNKKKL